MKERRRVWANYFHVNNFTCLSFRLTSEISPRGDRKTVQPREERLDRFTCVSVSLSRKVWNLNKFAKHFHLLCWSRQDDMENFEIYLFCARLLSGLRDIVNCLDSAPCTHQSTEVRYRVCADTANNIGFAARFLPKAPLSLMWDTAHVK